LILLLFRASIFVALDATSSERRHGATAHSFLSEHSPTVQRKKMVKVGVGEETNGRVKERGSECKRE
jgi:hypothetical protein